MSWRRAVQREGTASVETQDFIRLRSFSFIYFSFIYFVTLKIALLELHFTAYIRHSHLAVFSSL